MNSRKREAHTLLPTRHPKQPRLNLDGHSGTKPHPSEKEGIGTRWYHFFSDFMPLVGDTFDVVVPLVQTRPETDDSDSSVNQVSSDLVDLTSSVSSTLHQASSLLYPQSTTPHTHPISTALCSLKLQTSSPLSGANRSQYILQPESIPLPPSPIKIMHPSPTTSITIPASLNYDSLHKATPKHHKSFISSMSAGTPAHISIYSPTLITDSVLQPSVVPSMSNLQLNSRSIPTLHTSSDFSYSHRGKQASQQSSQSSSKSNYVFGNSIKREDIYSKVHKANVKRQHAEQKEQIKRDIYEIKRLQGFTSGYSDFKGLLDYQCRLENIDLESAPPPLPAGDEVFSLNRRRIFEDDDTLFLKRVLDNAKAMLNSPKLGNFFAPTLDQLQMPCHSKDADIKRRPHPLIVPLTTSLLPEEDEKFVQETLHKQGVVSKYAKEQVNQNDLSRLQPGQWLNDEVINFYGALILGRSENSKDNPPSTKWKRAQKSGPLNIHYFSSFFWAKLSGEGYEKGRLAEWTKKIDIFSKDVVLIPVNQGNAHWITAVINFRTKRFELYDSMGMAKENVFRRLRYYVKHEHLNKKKKDFDFTGWADWAPDSIPQQENGFDCGVFTCQFMEALSRGEETFRFSQKDMPYLRRRMIWEIGKAQLCDDC